MLKGSGVVGAGLSFGEAVPRGPKGQMTPISSVSVSVGSAVARETGDAACAFVERAAVPPVSH